MWAHHYLMLNIILYHCCVFVVLFLRNKKHHKYSDFITEIRVLLQNIQTAIECSINQCRHSIAVCLLSISSLQNAVSLSEFARKMETDVFKVMLRHLQHISRVGKEHITPFAVFGHVLVLALLECLKFRLVITLYPAGFVK